MYQDIATGEVFCRYCLPAYLRQDVVAMPGGTCETCGLHVEAASADEYDEFVDDAIFELSAARVAQAF